MNDQNKELSGRIDFNLQKKKQESERDVLQIFNSTMRGFKSRGSGVGGGGG